MKKINKIVIIAGSLVIISSAFGQGMHMQGNPSTQMPMQSSNPQGTTSCQDWGQSGWMQGGMMGMGGMMGSGMMGSGMMGSGMMGQGMMGGYHSGMMGGHSALSTTHLKHLFQRALMSTTDANKKKEIKSLKSSVITKVIRQKADLQIAEMELNDLLSSPDFDSKAVKKAVKKVMDAKTTLKTTILKGLVSLRQILGQESFGKVYPCPSGTGMMGSGMMMGSQQGTSQ